MPPKFREIERRLRAEGWTLVAQEGSHRQFKHPDSPHKVTLAGKPSTEPDAGTWRSIQRQAGWR